MVRRASQPCLSESRAYLGQPQENYARGGPLSLGVAVAARCRVRPEACGGAAGGGIRIGSSRSLDASLWTQAVEQLIMANARAVVVFVPLQAGTIEIDVLGRPACGYLLQNLCRLKDAEVCIVTATGARTCCGELADVTTRSMAELHGLDLGNQTVLLIDSRVWFSGDALARLFARVEQTGNGARVVARRRGVASADGEADTIAALCLPPRRDRSGLFRPLQAGSVTGLEQMVDSAVYAQVSRCEPEELDAEAPPLE